MGGEWEKVGTVKKPAGGTQTRSKVTTSKSKLPEPVKTGAVKPRKPLREKNAQNVTASHAQHVSSKQAPLKTLEECRSAIGNAKTLAKEIESLFERNQDRPNIWLNELTGYLVNKCNIAEKHIPKSQYLQGEYLTLPSDVDAVLANALKDNSARYIKSHTRSTLYHETLLSLSEDAARNRPTVGYKLMLQVLAKNFPQDCQKSISDRHFFHASQAHAYRSNPSTCMPLLWAMGLPFLAQPSSLTSQQAVDVLERAMIPVAENKPINHYVVYYLDKMVQQSKKINMKRPLLTPTTVPKIIDLMFNAHFDGADQAKLKDIVKNGLVIPAEAFENLLGLLDKNKNAEFRQFVLETMLAILSGSSGEEACQIWNLKYGSNVIESAILLKFLVDEMHNMNKKTKGLLSKTTKQFSKANLKFLESGLSSAESKKAMTWVDNMCEDVANGGSAQSRKIQSRSSTRSSKRAGGRTFLGSLFNLAYYGVIIYLLVIFTLDLSSASWRWSETNTRHMLVTAHPYIEQHLPTVEHHVHRTSDLIVSKTSEGYQYLHNLAPDQFSLVEQYLEVSYSAVQGIYTNNVYPIFNKSLSWLDGQFMELLIWVKSNEYDVKIVELMEKALVCVNDTSATIVKFLGNLSKDAPKHLEAARTQFLDYYRQVQLKVGKFLFELRPLLIQSWESCIEKCELTWQTLCTFTNANFGTAIEQGKVLATVVTGRAADTARLLADKAQPLIQQASNVVAPLWTELVKQFDQAFLNFQNMLAQ